MAELRSFLPLTFSFFVLLKMGLFQGSFFWVKRRQTLVGINLNETWSAIEGSSRGCDCSQARFESLLAGIRTLVVVYSLRTCP